MTTRPAAVFLTPETPYPIAGGGALRSAGRTLVKVNPAGTTQRCSACGEHVPKTLAQRVHDCRGCGLVLARDLNAALNVLHLAQGLGWSLQAPTVGGTRAVA